jgi:hypothetical protein
MAWADATERCAVRVVRGPTVMTFCIMSEPKARLIAEVGIIILSMDIVVDSQTLE